MRPLKTFWPRTESSNRVRSCAFGTDPSSKKQSWMNSSSDDWKKVFQLQVSLFLEYSKDNFGVLLDGLIWYVLCGICSLNK